MSKIIVLGKTVETTEISSIKEIEHAKTAFLNREAGFIIYLIDKEPLIFGERIPYERTDSQIAIIKNKWDDLRKKIYEKWQEDKSPLPTFNFD